MTPKATPRTSPLNVHLSSQAKADLTFLQKHLGDGITQKEVVQQALAGYRMYVQSREAGRAIFTRTSEGTEEGFHLLGTDSPW